MNIVLYLLVFLLCLFLVVNSYFSNKFHNKFKLYFFFGKKGSGKSTYFTKLASRYLRKGYTVYSDSPMKIDGVRLFNPRDLGKFYPPRKSVLFIDEAGILYDNRKFAQFKSEWLEFYKLQRHAKLICYLGSQNFDIDLKIRTLVDRMYLVRTRFNTLVCCRRVDKDLQVIQPNENINATADIVDTLKLCPPIPFAFVKYCYIPCWYKLHDSYSLPDRPELDYKLIKYDKKSDIMEIE